MNQEITSKSTNPGALAGSNLPPLFVAADRDAAHAQQRFFGLLSAELALLGLGALAGLLSALPFIPSSTTAPFAVAGVSIPALPYADLASAALIAIALVLRLWRFGAHPEDRWYEARAIAESAKSVAWRYAVGGRPFDLGKDQAAVDALARQRFREALTVTPNYQPDAQFAEEEQITPTMRALRMQPAEARRETYRIGRIADQRAWYERNAKRNRTLSRRAHLVIIGLEALAVVAALLQALQIVPVNTQAVLTALIGGGIAWTQARRYQDLGASYRLTAEEARKLEESYYKLEGAFQRDPSDATWAQFVDSAEEAFSREHNMWIATRDV
jgi:SMODS and SLOG-associating 2TM effector domain 1/SMODS and SLOG-associating 2TM effector domain 3